MALDLVDKRDLSPVGGLSVEEQHAIREVAGGAECAKLEALVLEVMSTAAGLCTGR